MKLAAIALAIVAGLAPHLLAGYPPYQQHVVVVEPVALPVTVPLFSVFNVAPPAAPPVVPVSAAQVPAPPLPEALLRRLDSMESALARLVSDTAELPPVAIWTAGNQASSPASPPTADRAGANIGAVASLLSARCGTCHTSPGRRGVNLFDRAGTFSPNRSAAAIWDAVKDDTMPPTPNKLTAAEKTLLAAWAKP